MSTTLPEDDLDPMEAVEAIVASRVAGVAVSFMAKVLEVTGPHQVSVQPTVRVRLGGAWQRPAPIARVPVMFLGGGGAEVRATLAPGDRVLCLCVDRSLDEWLAGGEDITPVSRRRHSLTDAVVIGRLEPFNAEDPSLEQGDVVVGQRDVQGKRLLVGPSGVSLGDGDNDLVQVVHDLLEALSGTTVATLAGAQPLSSALDLAALQAKVAQIKRG